MEKKSKNKNGKEKKKTAKKSENKRGRPTKMTNEVIGKLEMAFSTGATDIEACIVADINPDTLYEYCKKNPEFSERKEVLKKKPVLKAKQIVINYLNSNDIDTAKWYLERKARDEFAAKQEVAVGNLESSPFKIEIID